MKLPARYDEILLFHTVDTSISIFFFKYCPTLRYFRVQFLFYFQQSARTPELASAQGKVAYSFYTEFQSHEPEFDYLKSLEIEEKINCIRWCKNRGNGMFLLSTNDKTIKLWKIYEKNVRKDFPDSFVWKNFFPKNI